MRIAREGVERSAGEEVVRGYEEIGGKREASSPPSSSL